MSGEAASYYNSTQGYQSSEQPAYQQQQPWAPQYPMQTSGNGHGSELPQPPPSYGQNFTAPTDGKQSFEQTFKIQKPKFNDIWAGLLVRL